MNDEGPLWFISSRASEKGIIIPCLYHVVDPIWLDLREIFKMTSPQDPRCHTCKISLSMSMGEINDALENDMDGAQKCAGKKSWNLIEPFVYFGKKKVNNKLDSSNVLLIQSYDKDVEPFKSLSSISQVYYDRWMTNDSEYGNQI